MPGSNFSIVNGADGVTKIPVSTPVNDTNGNTVVAHLAMTNVAGIATPISAANPEPVAITNFPASQPVTGTFWQAIQPVSLAMLPPLATGSSTIGGVTQSGVWSVGLNGAVPAGSNAIGSVSVSNLPTVQPVSGSVSVVNLPATQAVTAASLPLPVGAATAANQAVPGAAGAPSAAVLSVQGVPGGAPQPVAAANGVSVTASSVTLAAGASTQVVGANTARKSLAVFFLSGSATGYLTPGSAATVANGIPLGVAPSGGVSLGQAYAWEGSGVPTGAVSMFCGSPASVIVWEGQ